jgi:peptidoglycan hydrolase-like protein with peptidoglycan-binding domain
MRPVTPSASHSTRHPAQPLAGEPAGRPVGRPLRGTLTALVLALALAGTLVGLPSTANATARSSYIVLAPGDHGSRVVALQRYLHVTPTSGFYGSRTRQAVIRWQAAHHRNRTGMVGRLLWSAVRGSSARAPEPSRGGGRAGGLNWSALARCESGGNPGAVNPAGYYGLYQFSPSTWRSVGGSGMPHRASSGEQTHRAVILFGRTGASSWPSCGHHLFD